MRTKGLLILAAVLAGACGGTDQTGTTKQAGVEQPAARAAPDLSIEVTDLDATGIPTVSFQAQSAEPARLEWEKLTLTFPDGQVRSAVVNEGSAPYEQVNGVYIGGATFCHNQVECYDSAYIAGRYVVTYDGRVLEEADR